MRNEKKMRRRVHGVRRNFTIERVIYEEEPPKRKKRPRDVLKKLRGRRPAVHFRTVRSFTHTHREGMRTTAIVFLTVSLIGQSGWLWTRVLDRNSTPKGTIAHTAVRWLDERQSADLADPAAPAAYPTKLAIRGDGGMFGIQYSADGVSAAYRLTEDMWGAALGSAEPLESVQQNEYTAALKREMAYLEFDGSVPLELIAGWMGVPMPQNGERRTCGSLMLSKTGTDAYRLFVRDAETGTTYAAETGLTDEQFYQAAESFVPNDCTMAAETDTVIAPDTLQFTGEQTFATITFGPYTGSMTALLSALRMDGQAAQENVYSTTDGTRVYVSGDAVAEVTRGGVLTYRAENGVHAYEKGTLLTREAHRKCAQLGRSLSAQLLDAMNSGGEAHLTKAYTAADGRYVTVFSLRINGVPADNDLGYFARYEFEDGAMVRADVVLRTCEAAGDAVTVMPEKIAASSRRDATAALSLRYTDTAPLLPDTNRGQTDTPSEPLTAGGGTASGYLNTGTATEDDSWVTRSDSSGAAWNSTAEQTAAGLAETGVRVTAEAEWKFLWYNPTKPVEEDRAAALLPSEITGHMPDFLTPIGEGGERE